MAFHFCTLPGQQCAFNFELSAPNFGYAETEQRQKSSSCASIPSGVASLTQ
jgi:hypothetical protein